MRDRIETTTPMKKNSASSPLHLSPKTEITFPPGLSNHDRAVVHAECRKYGLRSKSHGKGETRAVTIYKPKEKSRAAGVFDLPLSAASAATLRSHFEAHPPTAAEVARAESEARGIFAGDDDDDENEGKKSLSMEEEKGTRNNDMSAKGGNGSRNKNGTAASMTPDQVSAARAAHAAAVKTAGPQLAHARANLPIAAFREEILKAVRSSRVVLVAGETGCGKTTQVRDPSFSPFFFAFLFLLLSSRCPSFLRVCLSIRPFRLPGLSQRRQSRFSLENRRQIIHD
jgi:ATP-dependent RNA helicase DHX36